MHLGGALEQDTAGWPPRPCLEKEWAHSDPSTYGEVGVSGPAVVGVSSTTCVQGHSTVSCPGVSGPLPAPLLCLPHLLPTQLGAFCLIHSSLSTLSWECLCSLPFPPHPCGLLAELICQCRVLGCIMRYRSAIGTAVVTELGSASTCGPALPLAPSLSYPLGDRGGVQGQRPLSIPQDPGILFTGGQRV